MNERGPSRTISRSSRGTSSSHWETFHFYVIPRGMIVAEQSRVPAVFQTASHTSSRKRDYAAARRGRIFRDAWVRGGERSHLIAARERSTPRCSVTLPVFRVVPRPRGNIRRSLSLLLSPLAAGVSIGGCGIWVAAAPLNLSYQPRSNRAGCF